MANLACLELHPHPVRADDLDHPDELRVDLDSVPASSGRRSTSRMVRATLDVSARSVGRRRRVRAVSTSTCASGAAIDEVRRAARLRARSNGAPPIWRRANGRKNARRVPRLQPERERSHHRQRLPVRPQSMPACRRRWHGTRSTTATPPTSR
jgi:hypothetical protein